MTRRCTVAIQGHLKPRLFEAVKLEELTADILAERVGRDEIVFDLLDDHTGRLGGLVLAPLWPREPGAPEGRWCLTFNEPGEQGRWCLAEGSGTREKYWWHVWLGAEMEILDCCAVPLPVALSAARQCCTTFRREESVRWVDFYQAFNL